MPPLDSPHTDVASIPALLADLRKTFDSGRTRPLSWRREQIRRLRALVVEREKELHDALRADLGRHPMESWIAETGFVAKECAYVEKRLARWARPERVPTPLVNQLGSSKVVREPLGVVLIIAPWNYPVQLVLSPLLGALAAGNCAVLKPSELTPHVSAVLGRLVPEYLDRSAVRVVEGGVDETTALLRERWDHVFFTGGGTVGRVVMEAASKHLTPVTLELGGKSPCIVLPDANLDVGIKRIVWGKFFNAGQTCVAPDYLLVHESIADTVVERLRATVREFFGDDPSKSESYPRIVSERHLRRLVSYLEGQEIAFGGQYDEKSRYLAPTVLRNVSPTSKVMMEEIFGPILPVLTIRSLDEAIRFINARDKPLALYVYTGSSAAAEEVIARTSAGGMTINDCMAHLGVPELPFGGVGPSGMGAYHGRASFETFSHRKSVLDKSTLMDPPVRYAPYDANKEKWIRRLMGG
jgi:aldehyde dehydrogenase (NAD+)